MTVSPLTGLGDCVHATVAAGKVDDEAIEIYERFLALGRHGSMAFLERNREVRNDTRLLLDNGAKTLICFAFPYYSPKHNPLFSRHSQGLDYHYVIKKRLQPVIEWLKALHGAESRVCVDSAPVRERYWAQKAGLGFIGRNQQLIVPGWGSYVFLAEIATEAQLQLSSRHLAEGSIGCLTCGRCVKSCPGAAIGPDGSFDARKCLSYKSIEKGKIPETGPVFGCDACQNACPWNKNVPQTLINEFHPSEAFQQLDKERFMSMARGEYARFFRGTALMRRRPR